MQLNYTAVTIWAFCFLVGFLLGGLTAGLISLAVALGVSILADLFA